MLADIMCNIAYLCGGVGILAGMHLVWAEGRAFPNCSLLSLYLVAQLREAGGCANLYVDACMHEGSAEVEVQRRFALSFNESFHGSLAGEKLEKEASPPGKEKKGKEIARQRRGARNGVVEKGRWTKRKQG
ncbi:hypothetical protein IE53DRAFT_386614 [Violaceomyces palustris]|uniref:Uncharacterized protein n=1 Tax=Violaceomyces palustris TaxID=1673888 RepID=A0ACD0NZ52_9BASI|nr:hypothetical protein IE53DRAFT_386614 [Violaceomyces palustris]